MRVRQRAKVFFFPLPFLPWDRELERSITMKPEHGPLTDNKLGKGYQAGGVQGFFLVHPGLGADRRANMTNTTLSVGFHNPETVSGML